jgi:hypothetical protein
MTKPPRQFFAPLASGAPEPMRELPVKLERMIHFVPAHNEKLRSPRRRHGQTSRRHPREPRRRDPS